MNSQTIGDYLIKRTIGRGTFSKVKLAVNKTTSQKVAIKILEKSKIIEPDDLERIVREMAIIIEFNHPNVVVVHEIFETDEHYLIIMDYCSGGELFNYIVVNQRLEEDEASFFYYQLINGVEYIHSKNIVHRDLKPENLLLTKLNMLKIIDFGFSDADSYCSFKAPAGTKAYASPELLAGENIDARSDIWSLGVIINELSGRYRHVSSRCLRRDKEKRYASTADVKKAVLHESARKIRNLTTIAAVLITAAAVLYTLYINKEPAIPETTPAETETATTIKDTVKTAPAPTPAEVPDEASKRKTPTSEVPQHNSSESLDADALEDLFKDAAELIL
jgi:5'-AMP-activated protein kinase catalytic alpha subunit